MNDNFSSEIAIKLQFCHCKSNKKVFFNNNNSFESCNDEYLFK